MLLEVTFDNRSTIYIATTINFIANERKINVHSENVNTSINILANVNVRANRCWLSICFLRGEKVCLEKKSTVKMCVCVCVCWEFWFWDFPVFHYIKSSNWIMVKTEPNCCWYQNKVAAALIRALSNCTMPKSIKIKLSFGTKSVDFGIYFG